METFWQDLRYAVRILGKDRAFTTLAVLTLALGIGANTAIFSLLDTLLLRQIPVQRPEELMQVQLQDPRWPEASPSFTNPLWEQLRDRQDVFSGVFAWGAERFDLGRGGAVQYVNGIWVSGDFFNTLGVRPWAGRLIAATDDQRGCPAVAALSYDFWQRHYGGSGTAAGSTLLLSTQPFEVIGVAPPGFHGLNVGARFDVAVPVCAAALFDGKESRLEQRSWWWLTVAGRAKPGLSVRQMQARLAVLSPAVFGAAVPPKWPPEMQKGFLSKSVVTVPAATGTSSSLRRRFDRPLRILMAIVGMVLLIACANIASLMLARAAARHKEIALRQALGASRTRLIRQLLTECILLSCSGALLGILFARWGTVLLLKSISTARDPVFLDLSLSGRTMGFTAAVAILTGILFGILPALRSTRTSLAEGVKKTRTPLQQGSAGGGARAWIVASQVALSLVLVVSAGLLLRTFARLSTLDLGFDRNNVLLVQTDLKTAKVPPDRQLATYEAIENRLRAIPGIESAARSTTTPIGGSTWNESIRSEWSRELSGDDALAWFNYVSPGYFDTLRMPLLAGRGFTDSDTKAAPMVAIVNQTLARRFFPNRNPLGQTFRIDIDRPGPPIQIVGLIKDSKYESIREETPPTAFFPAAQVSAFAENEIFELRTALSPSSMTPAVQAAVAGVSKAIPIELRTLEGQVQDSLVQERMLAMLSAFFGGLALLLAMIGLYGTLSYLVTQRRTEFGIRLALGAPAGAVLWLVMRDLLLVLGAGLAVGAAISLTATRLLRHMLFGLEARDTVTLIEAAVILAAVALAAGYLPARRATKVDPMTALRYD